MCAYMLNTSDIKPWKTILNQCEYYDVYHLPEYHSLVEKQDNVQGRLFVFETGRHLIAMPMLFRRIIGDAWGDASRYYDVTSVYGYPGPVSNNINLSEEIIRDFVSALQNYLQNEKVVSIFSRLNPLFDQTLLLGNKGEMLDIGPTVVIDLCLPVDVQFQQYRSGHTYDIKKARQSGVTCIHDENWDYLEDFIDIYYATMNRVDAEDGYFFEREYFYRLRNLLGDHLHLFIALKENDVVSAALFTVCNSIIQYHLSGTASGHRNLAPNKLILDTVRLWGTKNGAKLLHLGGGVGGKEDGLFRFKSGFSNLTRQFKVWRMIVNEVAYRQLTEQKRVWNRNQDLEVGDEDYFPVYRAPTRECN